MRGGLKETIVHESTHQVAFNTGLHSRIGKTPKWIVEGLATVFESTRFRNSSGRSSAKTRINRDRFVRFGNFAKTRRPQKSLTRFIEGDLAFQMAPLDAYSQAWALNFFLIETRPSKYVRWLKTIASRDPMKDYPKEQRIADFKKCIGNDVDWLEVDFLRFVERLK